MRTEIYRELVDLKYHLRPRDEFMCICASHYGLSLAQDVVQAAVKAKGELCLQTHWEQINGYYCDQFHWTCEEYQKFRLEWLDRLIEEYK